MFSIPELLIILAILFLNFAIIIMLSNRIVVVASVMIVNLIIILFYSIIIADYQNLKELIIATVVYSITILALISNTNHIDQISENITKSKSKIIILFAIIMALTISCGGFYLMKNIRDLLPKSSVLRDQFGNIVVTNNTPPVLDNAMNNPANSEQPKLKNNVLFKRSTDAILIIVGVMTILLLSSKYRNRESNI